MSVQDYANGLDGGERYDGISVAAHWLTALLIAGAWGLALVLDELPRGPDKAALIGAHKMIGVFVLAVTVARIGWALTGARKPAPVPMAPIMAMAAKGAHFALYALMMALPITGIVMSQAGGHPVEILGLFQLPTLIGEDKALAHDIKEVHEVLANGILVVIFAHAAAAIFHHRVLRDETLIRMTPFLGR